MRGLLIYCSDYRCSHLITVDADRWPDHVRPSDLERRFTCKACGTKGADVRSEPALKADWPSCFARSPRQFDGSWPLDAIAPAKDAA